MSIKNEFTVTKDMYLDWGEESRRKGVGGKFRIFWIVMAAMMFVVSVVVLFGEREYWYYGFYFLALGVVCIIRITVRYKVMLSMQYKKFAKLFGGENWTRTVEFTDDEIITINGNITLKNKYDEIIKMRTAGNKIWLDTDKGSVVRMYKDSFANGSFEELEKLLKAKSGI